MFKILIAPNSMKGSLNAFDFADAVESAFTNFSPDFICRKVPVADGGDFTGEVLRKALQATEKQVLVTGPLHDKTIASYWIFEKTAIIEMANASGMKLVRSERLNPMVATSFGTGELIADAIQSGCSEILLAIGGSATVDGGSGMLEALGFRFRTKKGSIINGSGGNLKDIGSIEIPGHMPENVDIKILCDVNNPLYGPSGAAFVFGPQKGATVEMVVQLDKGLRKWSELIEGITGKDFSEVPGMGAAGGISIGLTAFLNAHPVPGADFIFDLINIDDSIKWADLVITGEGKIDAQSLFNKAPGVLAKRARNLSKPIIALAGTNDLADISPFKAVFSIMDRPMTLEDSIRNSFELVRKQSLQIAGLLKCLKI